MTTPAERAGCCGKSLETCTQPPCPCNLDCYTDDTLREIAARRAGAVSFCGRRVEPILTETRDSV